MIVHSLEAAQYKARYDALVSGVQFSEEDIKRANEFADMVVRIHNTTNCSIDEASDAIESALKFVMIEKQK